MICNCAQQPRFPFPPHVTLRPPRAAWCARPTSHETPHDTRAPCTAKILDGLLGAPVPFRKWESWNVKLSVYPHILFITALSPITSSATSISVGDRCAARPSALRAFAPSFGPRDVLAPQLSAGFLRRSACRHAACRRYHAGANGRVTPPCFCRLLAGVFVWQRGCFRLSGSQQAARESHYRLDRSGS
jgi:hypothetical protein